MENIFNDETSIENFKKGEKNKHWNIIVIDIKLVAVQVTTLKL